MKIVDHQGMGMSAMRGTGEMRVIGRQIESPINGQVFFGQRDRPGREPRSHWQGQDPSVN